MCLCSNVHDDVAFSEPCSKTRASFLRSSPLTARKRGKLEREREWRSFYPHLVSPPFTSAQSLPLSPNLLLLQFTLLPLVLSYLFTSVLVSSTFPLSTIVAEFIGISPFQPSTQKTTTYRRLPKMEPRKSLVLKSTAMMIVRKVILPRRINIRAENLNWRSTVLGRAY